MNEVGLYGMPNLVGSATVMTSYSPVSEAYSSNNLITNLDNRSHRNYFPPIIDAEGTPASFKSCFTVLTSTISGPYIFGLDHGYEKTQHAVILV